MILLITPPFTQLNTPYPATVFLKGYLNAVNIPSAQVDLSIETFNVLYSKEGLQRVFDKATENNDQLSDNARRIYTLRQKYIEYIDIVMNFLQKGDPVTAHQICRASDFPQAARFNIDMRLEENFGSGGITDKAKYLSTLFIEDLGDFIIETIDGDFGFSRYAHKIASHAPSFDALHEKLQSAPSLIIEMMLNLLEDEIVKHRPKLIGISIPFPGNLVAALFCAKYIKSRYSNIKVALGGGFVNTELRNLKDQRIFEIVDFICLDDGEIPLSEIYSYLHHQTEKLPSQMMMLRDNKITITEVSNKPRLTQTEKGIPDYEGINLSKYISFLEISNPMHRLWNDGRWNKLMLAHGCYWHRCTFCDTSLDYIRHYEPVPADQLIIRIKSIIKQTGSYGFHFIDEAAPPALLKKLSLAILREKIKICWWANIRLDKSFDTDLCRLMAAAGCIGVSAGLEAASDRILKKINKGVDIEQAADVCKALKSAGIMIHTYLMYGFPTQTTQETVDSLEIVRQMFHNDLIQSAFWHQFALTVHSPVGLSPEEFDIKITSSVDNDFANNEISYEEKNNINHSLFGAGLSKAVYNYMHGVGIDYPVDYWFDFKVPTTTHHNRFIKNIISKRRKNNEPHIDKDVIFLYNKNYIQIQKNKTKNKLITNVMLHTEKRTLTVSADERVAEWFLDTIDRLETDNIKFIKYSDLANDFTDKTGLHNTALINSELWQILRQNGLLLV